MYFDGIVTRGGLIVDRTTLTDRDGIIAETRRCDDDRHGQRVEIALTSVAVGYDFVACIYLRLQPYFCDGGGTGQCDIGHRYDAETIVALQYIDSRTIAQTDILLYASVDKLIRNPIVYTAVVRVIAPDFVAVTRTSI